MRALWGPPLWAAAVFAGLGVGVFPSGAAAQQSTMGAEAGFVDARDFTGFTALGFFEARSLVFFARGAADVGFGGDDSGVEERDGNCVEVASDAVVNDSRCVKLDGGLTIRGGFRFPLQEKHVQLGVGYRFARSQSGVVGSASLRWPRDNGWWGVTLEVGEGIVRGTAGIGFDLMPSGG